MKNREQLELFPAAPASPEPVPAPTPPATTAAIVGGGPAGLMAAETLNEAGIAVDLYDAMPSVGRKFLLAGKGGLNLTHAEALTQFIPRYAERAATLAPLLTAFDNTRLRDWAAALGIETFVGSSGRVFPKEMKAAPLLRAWLHRLRSRGVRIHVRHRWLGWTDDGGLRFQTPSGEVQTRPAATILALGGASWPQLGSDGAWQRLLTERSIAVRPLAPANCGFEVAWSAYLKEKFAGTPLKSVVGRVTDATGTAHRREGECIVTEHGLEGGLIYALSAPLRDTLAATGRAVLELDLAPGWTVEKLEQALAHPRGSRSMASHIQSRTQMKGLKVALLREFVSADDFARPATLARHIKALALPVVSPRPIAEAISSAGGVAFEALDDHLMVKTQPGVFCAGEMLDWEAPTGGYLLTACFATGRTAGLGAAAWLRDARNTPASRGSARRGKRRTPASD